MKTRLILVGFSLMMMPLSAQNELKKAFSKTVNLQQESIVPYSKQENKEQSPYHYRPKEEHEIKYGRPMLNKNFEDPEIFHSFYKEQSMAYLKNFKALLMLDLYPERAYEGIAEKMSNKRRKILSDLEYSIYRAQTIEVENDRLDALQSTFRDAFQHLYHDYSNQFPDFIERFKAQEQSFLTYNQYLNAYENVFGHISASSMDLFDLLAVAEGELKEQLEPELTLKYQIEELLEISAYRHQLQAIQREAWHKSDAFFKSVLDKDVEKMQARSDECIDKTLQLMAKLKTIPKYESDISLKNNTNKYVKYVQTAGKSNFKKIISVYEKAEGKKLSKAEEAKVDLAFTIFKAREVEYLQNIYFALKELKKKYLDEAKANAKDDSFEEMKERERLKKAAEREAERARKTYWKKRNLPTAKQQENEG
ncbi:MAG: hypothetical protein ACPGEC_02040 [Flavobacteriales bacterium]